MPEISGFLAWVKKYAGRNPGIKKVTLYGSFARGDATHLSDIDLAFELAEADRWPEIADEVRENPVVLRKLDLVCLNTAGQALKKKISREGRILYERRR